jgi:hypothetical protein
VWIQEAVTEKYIAFHPPLIKLGALFKQHRNQSSSLIPLPLILGEI